MRILIPVAALSVMLCLSACTSPDAPDDQSVLDTELDNLDTDPSAVDDEDGESENAEVEDIEEANEESLEDELADVESEEVAEEEGEAGDGEDEFAEEDEAESAEEGSAEGDDEGEEELAEGEGGEVSDDELMAEEGGEKPVAKSAADEEALAKELGNQQGFPEDVPSGPLATASPDGQNPMDATIPQDMQAGGVPPVVSTTLDQSPEPPAPKLPQDDLGTPDPLVAKADDFAQEQNWVPVVKMKTNPYFASPSGRLMNTVYLTRPGDNIESIATKIFGSTSKTQELLDDNPHLDRGMDPGDKVYYNSPNNPEAKSTIKVFYEDIDLKPSRYITQNGDNMRRLGSKLLGFQEGWKEIWAINANVDSKTELTPGIELRYWTGDEAKFMAKAEVEEGPRVEVESPVAIEDESLAPQPPSITEVPPVTATAEPDLPEEPPQIEEPINLADPEPLPEAEIGDESESARAAMAEKKEDAGTSLLTVGMMALIVLAAATLVAIQIKNRQASVRRPPPSLEFTQV